MSQFDKYLKLDADVQGLKDSLREMEQKTRELQASIARDNEQAERVLKAKRLQEKSTGAVCEECVLLAKGLTEKAYVEHRVQEHADQYLCSGCHHMVDEEFFIEHQTVCSKRPPDVFKFMRV